MIAEYNRLISLNLLEGLSNTQQIVYSFIFNNPNVTDDEISKGTEMKLTSVLARRNELMKDGLVVESGSVFNNLTKRDNTSYSVTDTQEIKRMEKITKVGLYGFMVEGKEEWNNYDKKYKGSKLTQEDKGKLVTYGVNPAGYVTFIKFESESTPIQKIEDKGKRSSLSVKVITSDDPSIFEGEINEFGRNNKVVATQTHSWGAYLVAVVYYE